MIFINISKKSVVKGICVALSVFVIGISVVSVVSIIKIKELNRVNRELNKNISELERVVECRDEEIKGLTEEIEKLEGKIEEINSMSIPNINKSIKTYMDFQMISKTSKQGGIVYSEEAWTDEDGLRRWGDYYCVALGSYYGAVGDKFWVETDKGNKYKIIKADEKADIHTDPSNRYTVATGCMMEWIVETNKLAISVKRSGNINNVEKVSGNITNITKIEE